MSHRGDLSRSARRVIAVCVAGLGLLAPAAVAQSWTETSDAGDLPGTAQSPAGVGALSTITGALPASR
jgi:hypothetical protein